MSLVYEALQKAEREKERKLGQPVVKSAAPPVPVPVQQPAAPKSNLGYRLILGVLIVGGVLGTVVLIGWIQRSVQVARPQVSAAPPPESATPPIAQPVASVSGPTENDTRFRLTGIMGLPEGGFGAVINGKTVREQFYVDGAIVKKIERDRVTLDLNGVTIVARLF